MSSNSRGESLHLAADGACYSGWSGVVGPPLSQPLLGQIVLEALDLVVDCAKGTLGPRPESPDNPLLNLR